MGLTYADIVLVNTEDRALAQRGYLKEEEIRKVFLTALVDTGANTLVINEKIQKKLGIAASGEKNVRTADGQIHLIPVVKGVEVRFQDRDTTCDAFVSVNGQDCLLGAIPIEGLDVVVDLNKQKLIANPEHPNGPVYMLM